jgi:hypothetical protein
MMQTIHCVECGSDTIGLHSISVDVNLKKRHHCDKCYHGHTETRSYFFCSEMCFHAYLLKVVEGMAKFEFKTYDPKFGQNEDVNTNI